MSFKIQLADWRDREPVESLRRETDLFVDGGLYELLHWPIFHVHIARLDGRVVGYVATQLQMGGRAEDVGGSTLDGFRRSGIAKALRATQMRDLQLLGVDTFHATVRTTNDAANAFAQILFGEPVARGVVPELGTFYDYTSTTKDIYARLGAAGAARPYPLSSMNQTKLLQKREQAAALYEKLGAIHQLAQWKVSVRG